MKYRSKAYIYFSISGKNLDANEFVGIAQISPTELGENRIGEKFLEYKIEAQDADEGLDEAIEKLAATLLPKSEEIRAYAAKKELYKKIFVVIQSNNENTGVFLNSKFIRFLNTIDAEIEIDIYP